MKAGTCPAESGRNGAFGNIEHEGDFRNAVSLIVMQEDHFLEAGWEPVDGFGQGGIFCQAADFVIRGEQFERRMPQDDFFQPGAAPQIPAPVERHLQEPGFFPAGNQLRTGCDQPDKNILRHIFRALTVSKIIVGYAENIGSISFVKLIKGQRGNGRGA